MRRLAAVILAGGLAALAFAPALRSQTAKPVLVRVDKPAIARIPAGDLGALLAVQELRQSWIVSSPSDIAARLVRDIPGLDLLDADPEGRIYYLIRTPTRQDVEVLERNRPSRQVEPGIALVRHQAGDPGEVMSIGLEVTPMGSGPAIPLAIAARVPPAASVPAELAVRDDPSIAEMVAAVSRDRLATNIRELESARTRFTTSSASVGVANRLYDYFRGLGLQATYQDFTFDGTWNKQPVPGIRASNIVATIPGTATAAQIVVVGAHYDSVSGEDSPILAPGADDDASGTSVVMEIARVFAGRSFDYTIRFVAFAAEEWGLRGSAYAAAVARQRTERIIAMVNLDMVAYADAMPEDLNLMVNERSQWLAAKYAGASARYAPLATSTTVDASWSRSDHWPFWQNGYDAVHALEDNPVTNPHYHKVTDTLDTLNLDFATAVTRTTLAVVADLAQPSRTPSPPPSISAQGYLVRSLFTQVKVVRVGWTPSPSAQIAGYHVYRSVTPHLGYERITVAPVRDSGFTDRVPAADKTYYYVVTAVDASGQESNFSIERADDGSLDR